MGYVRKTKDRWDIESYHCGQWDVETSEYTLKEAREQLKCYRENFVGSFSAPLRIVKRREKIQGV